MALIPKPLFGQFCMKEMHTIDKGFIIGQNIYFGSANHFWKYSRELNKVLDNKLHSDDIFGKSNDM